MYFFLLSFITSVVGAISGIGGGILLKPVLDLTSGMDVAHVNFFSNCTVLSMAAMTIFRRRSQIRGAVDIRTVFLTVGSVAGGIAGAKLFSAARAAWDSGAVRTMQSVMLIVLCSLIIIYMLSKAKIKSCHLKSRAAAMVAGLALGIISAFLGIGGGLVNMVVLTFLFSIESRTATLASIFIVFCSQAAGLAFNAATGFPPVDPVLLAAMIAGGMIGGTVGGSLAKKASSRQTDISYMCVTGVVIAIAAVNVTTSII